MSKITVGIVDYGAGNLVSVQRTLQSLGYRTRSSNDPAVLDLANIVVLPGVGAFPAAMAALSSGGLDRYLVERVRSATPVIGICLGMHMLLDASHEYGVTAGLGLIPGDVKRMSNKRWHIGWNSLEVTSADPLFQPTDGESLYFNHSFVCDVPQEYCSAIVRNPEPLPVAIRRGSVVGLQFHPEKSQAAGRNLLANLIEGLCA